MSKSPFQSFIDLIKFDQSFHAFEKEIITTSQALELLKKERAVLENDLEAIRLHVRELKKEVDSKEFEMKHLDEQEKEKRSRLERAGKDKEYQSLKREADSLRKKQHDYEDVLVAVWNSYETAEKSKQDQEKEFTQKLDDLTKQEEEKDLLIKQAQQKINESQSTRLQKLKNIPQEWLERYDRMKNTVQNPVVEVVSGSCSACFYTLPLQDVMELKKEDLLQCKDCYRFLYSGKIEEEQAASEKILEPESKQEKEQTQDSEE